jgi:tRNA (guanine-N7-)-methyltransferase
MVGIEDTKASTKPAEESTRAPISADERFAHAPFDPAALFPSAAPLEIELGTGKGRFLIESGRRHPERNYLGLERSLSYYRIARDRIRRSGLSNIRLLRADASEFVREAPDESVESLHAYFPDPWPKKKQRKRRLIDASLLAAAFRKTRPGGAFRIVTDHADLAAAIGEAIEAAIRAGAGWEKAPWESGEIPPPTHYELKYLQAGREFFRFHLRKPTLSEG